MARLHDETRPLLTASLTDGSLSRVASRTSRSSKASDRQSEGAGGSQTDRLRLEDDALPEESVLGRNIGWTSAHILAISRVTGGGIFAVPGVVLKSVGSTGMALTLLVLGALVTACALAVSPEYGCVLPRSSGEKVYLAFAYPRPRFQASTIVTTQAILLGFTASNCIIISQWQYAIQNSLGWIKAGLVTFMVFAALYVVLFKPNQTEARQVQATERWDDLWEDTRNSAKNR